MSEVGHRTSSSRVTTLLIPEMNFTCNATIIGFIVAGTRFDREPHSQVQIWRKNNSHVYYLAGNFSMDTAGKGSTVCVAERIIVGNTRWCILHNNLQVSVQPGDIFGLELPSTNGDEIFFTSGGPVNYIFEHQLDSNVNLSHNETNVEQLPQIVFNLTAGKLCVFVLNSLLHNVAQSLRQTHTRHTHNLIGVVAMLKKSKYIEGYLSPKNSMLLMSIDMSIVQVVIL